MRRYIFKNKGYLAIWMFFEILFAGLMVVWSLFMSRLLEAGMNADLSGIRNLLLGGVIFFVAAALSFYLQTFFCAKYVSRCTCDLKDDLFRKIIEADANSFTEYNCAKYISLFNNDVLMVAKDFFQGIPAAGAQLLLSAAAMGALFYYNVWLALFTIAMSICTAMIPALVTRNSADVQKEYTKMLGVYNTRIKDYISAAPILKSYHVEEEIKKVHSNVNTKTQAAYLKVQKTQGTVYAVIQATNYLEGILFLVLSAYLIANGNLTVPMMLGASQVTNYVTNPVKQAAYLFANYKRTKLILKDLENIFQNEAASEQKEALKTFMPLEIRHLYFSYAQEQILKDISVRFEQGKKYAIIGESGSGKSTLVKIIMQYLPDYEGEILIGEQNVRAVTRESFVKNYALIQQEVLLFEDTLRNNITMYGVYDEGEILQAVHKAGLDKFYRSLENGLDSLIGENGANCSGGERQRITIARALLRKTPVLIMDEATSNLDVNTACQLEALLLNNPELTVISITHRVGAELFHKYDKVLKLEGGTLISLGDSCI